MHGRAEERKTGRAGRVEVWMDDNETMEFLVELSSATTYTNTYIHPQRTHNTNTHGTSATCTVRVRTGRDVT